MLVDFDPQANATSGLGFSQAEETGPNAYDVLLGADPRRGAPADGVSQPLAPPVGPGPRRRRDRARRPAGPRERSLRDALDPIAGQFDFVLIDCPPSLSLLTVNALTAADSVLVPIQTEYFALEGLSELLESVERVRHSFNPSLAIEGIVLTHVRRAD